MGNISQIIQWDLIAYIVNNDFYMRRKKEITHGQVTGLRIIIGWEN